MESPSEAEESSGEEEKKKRGRPKRKQTDQSPDPVPAKKSRPVVVAALTMEQRFKIVDSSDPVARMASKKPAFFQLPLYNYQLDGLEFLETSTSGRALIMEMGLGKTCVVLAYLCNRINAARVAGNWDDANRPHLVVVPKSVKESWITDFGKFIRRDSGITFLCIGDQKPSETQRQEIRTGVYNIVVLSYEQALAEFTALVKPFEVLPKTFNFMKPPSIKILYNCCQNYPLQNVGKGRPCPLQINDQGLTTQCIGNTNWLYGQSWATIVLDEAHRIRNAHTKTFLACCALQGERRIYSSGTPLHNNHNDLYNCFRFLRVPELAPLEQWVKMNDGGSSKHLADVSKKHMYWKRKNEVEDVTIVPKRVFHYKCSFESPEESAFYDYWRDYLGRLADDAQATREQHIKPDEKGYTSTVHVFSAIAKARQCCTAPGIIQFDPKDHPSAPKIPVDRASWAWKGSTKMRSLKKMITEHLQSDEKFLIFSGMVEALAIARDAVEQDLGIKCEWLTGEQDAKERRQSIQRFKKDPSVRGFCISLKAGGEGLNLEEASRVFIIDPWWDPQSMFQAMDRSHRVSSKKEVRVTILSIQGTIEDIVLERAEYKRKLAEDVYQAVSLEDALRKNKQQQTQAIYDPMANLSTGRSLSDMMALTRRVNEVRTYRYEEAGSRAWDEEQEFDANEKKKAELAKLAPPAPQPPPIPQVPVQALSRPASPPRILPSVSTVSTVQTPRLPPPPPAATAKLYMTKLPALGAPKSAKPETGTGTLLVLPAVHLTPVYWRNTSSIPERGSLWSLKIPATVITASAVSAGLRRSPQASFGTQSSVELNRAKLLHSGIWTNWLVIMEHISKFLQVLLGIYCRPEGDFVEEYKRLYPEPAVPPVLPPPQVPDPVLPHLPSGELVKRLDECRTQLLNVAMLKKASEALLHTDICVQTASNFGLSRIDETQTAPRPISYHVATLELCDQLVSSLHTEISRIDMEISTWEERRKRQEEE